MTKTFKTISRSDAINAYHQYIEKGKPKYGVAFELLMTKVMINRINNNNSQVVPLTKIEFEAYQHIVTAGPFEQRLKQGYKRPASIT